MKIKEFINAVIIPVFCGIGVFFLTAHFDWVKQQIIKLTEDTTYLSELEYVSQNGTKLIYKDNVLFSGKAWSSDGTTLCIIVESGRPLEGQGKNPNNTNAIVVNTRPGQSFAGRTSDRVFYFNDGNGNLVAKLAEVDGGFICNDTFISNNECAMFTYIREHYPSYAKLLDSYDAIMKVELKKRQ